MPGQRIQNVQALRFLAAASVVLSHVAGLLVPLSQANRWFWSVPWTAGVDLFFVISGFIMLSLTHEQFGSPGAATDFLKRRIIRIVPNYCFFTTLTIAAVLLLGGSVKGTTVDLAQVVTSYSFIPWPRADGEINPILAQGWTLNYEAFFYIAFTLALLVRRGLVALCVVFLLAALISPFVPTQLFMLEFWSNPIILEFLGGILLAKVYLTGQRLPFWGSSVCVALAVIVFVVTGHVHWGSMSRVVRLGIPAVLLGASLVLAPEPARSGPIRRMIQRAGDASYTIYLAHYMIIHVFVWVWLRIGLKMPWLGVGAGMIVSIGASIAFFELVERPVTEHLRRRFNQHRSLQLQKEVP